MLRRIFQQLNQKIKPVITQMASPKTKDPLPVNPAGEKRPLSDEDGENNQDAKKAKEEGPAVTQPRADRKRAVAIFFGYNGKGYFGLQLNPGHPTIESELIKALLEVGVIPQEHHDSVQKMSFQRAARTDKGVSAIGNVVSLKMLLNVENLLEKINDRLPPQIRVFDIRRTTKGFNSKNFCDARSYIYLLPTYAFSPTEVVTTTEYRISDEIIASVNSILKRFVGTHNFHNFTSGIKPWEKQAQRYIMSFECGRPYIQDGMEFVVLRVKGQSFVLHHIRKMIGLTIAIQRGMCGVETIEEAWKPDKVDVPKAPGLGLVLEKLYYNRYNKRFCSQQTKDAKDQHAKLEWDDLAEQMEKFTNEMIFSHIVKTEKAENSMLQWLSTLTFHSFSTDESPWRYGRRKNFAQKSSSPKTDTDKSDSNTEEPVSEPDGFANQTLDSDSVTNQNSTSDPVDCKVSDPDLLSSQNSALNS